VRRIFKLLNATLEKAAGKLSDMVQMTVFITDVRYGDRLTQIRREIFGDNFPGSALITITALANPDAKIEIQGYAVIGEQIGRQPTGMAVVEPRVAPWHSSLQVRARGPWRLGRAPRRLDRRRRDRRLAGQRRPLRIKDKR
jgi:hypothetical protein